MSSLLSLYALLGRGAAPLLRLHLRRRGNRGKEDPARANERFGMDSRPRPEGLLLWVHAASIGESVSILPVIERLCAAADGPQVLLTTVTRSSAELMVPQLPKGARHAFAPLDVAPALDRFLDHWRPDATVIVEQELWPLLLSRSPAPRLLVNARLSARSAARWRRLKPVASALLARFDRILAQSTGDAERLRGLGAANVETPGNLKLAATPLAADEKRLATLKAAVAGRPVWAAASTHAPEEQWVAEVDHVLRQRFPDLLTLIVPRHPHRAATIRDQLDRGDITLWSEQEAPGDATGIHVVDAFGVLGLVYRLASVAFVGGSLVPHGGQNPLEPARLGCAVLFGPHMTNFEEPASLLLAAGGARHVDRAGFAEAVGALLASPPLAAATGAAASQALATAGDAAIARTTTAIRNALGLP